MNPFKKIGNAIKNSIQALFGKGPWSDEYAKIVNLVPQALSAVEYVAEVTTGFDADNKFAQMAREWLGRNVTISEAANSRGALLQAMARSVLNGRLVNAEKEHILNAAIELALVAFKKGVKSK